MLPIIDINSLYVKGQKGQIALIEWINGTWNFPQKPLLLANGTTFKPNTCPGMTTVVSEYVDYDFKDVEYDGQLLVRHQKNSDQNEVVLQVSYPLLLYQN